MAKKELTLSEFREIIKEEALKLKKRIVLENEKKALLSELGVINESYMEEYGMEGEMEMEEGVFDNIGKALGVGKEARIERLKKQFADFSSRLRRPFDQASFDQILQQAATDDYQGVIQFSGTKQNPEIVYKMSKDAKWAGGLGGPDHFGGK